MARKIEGSGKGSRLFKGPPVCPTNSLPEPCSDRVGELGQVQLQADRNVALDLDDLPRRPLSVLDSSELFCDALVLGGEGCDGSGDLSKRGGFGKGVQVEPRWHYE